MASFARHPSHPYNRHSHNPNPPHQHGQDMEMEMQPHGHGRNHGKVERDSGSPMLDAEMARPARRGCNPFRALVIALKSSSVLGACTNVLIPFSPIGLVLHWLKPEWHLWIFLTNYLAMIPMANLLAFSSAQFARRLPRVFGVMLQLTVASAVEVILCLVLLFKDQYQVIQAALLGSMLANLLLCTGLCFVVGGIRTKAQEFSETVSETGGGLLLVSVAALMLPCAFFESVSNKLPAERLEHRILHISRFSAILLLIAYVTYLFFQLATHHSEFDEALAESERRNKDRADKNRRRENLTTGEAGFFTFLSLTLVTLHAIFLVRQIDWMVRNKHVSDAFMGLILVPLVEKAAEHLKGINEAWNNAMDFALSHLLGSTIQTALLVSPIVVLVGWAAHKPFDLNFEVFMVVALVFSVLIVGNFIKDGKSNYLEGALCCIFYLMIAVTTWYYPNPPHGAEAE